MSIKIDQALIAHFIDAGTGLPIAHENINYTPTGDAYAEIIVLPNDTTALNYKHTNQTDGVFRAILRYPSGRGALPSKTAAEIILNHFKIATLIEYDGVLVEITGSKREPGVQEDGWYKLVLTVPYRAFITR